MDDSSPDRLPPGRQPYDPANGLRVGAFVGGLVGGGLTALLGTDQAWLVLAGAVLGGALGYGVERAELRQRRGDG